MSLFLSFLSSSFSDKDEKGRFFPLNGLENFDTASLFCNSSNNFILRLTFLFSIFNSDIAASILSPPTNLEGLASDVFTAMFDFFIKKSKSQFSGLTIKPLLSELITFTVIISFIFLSLNQSNGSSPNCFNPTLTFCSSFLISNILTLILSPFLNFLSSSSPLLV